MILPSRLRKDQLVRYDGRHRIYVLTDFDDVPVAGAASVLGFGWIFPVRRI